MNISDYVVTFDGQVLPGHDLPTVKHRFADLFRLAEAQVEQVFARPPVVLKRVADAGTAARYCERLRSIGMSVTVDHGPSESSRPVQPDPHDMPSAPLVDASVTPVASVDSVDGGAASVTPTHDWTDEATNERVAGIEFTGNGRDFFRIWIVNLALTIVTLGIYSAWAKVRTLSYFYGNTKLDGNAFEYRADPIKILKGRLIAAAVIFAYSVAGQFSPVAGFVMALLLAIATPWMIVQSLRFNSRYTRWRGIAFGFDGRHGAAAGVFIGWPFFGLLTLGTLLPLALYKQRRFVIDHWRYGAARFSFAAEAWDFYKMAFKLLAMGLAGVLVVSVLGFIAPLAAMLGIIAMYLVLFAVYTCLRANLTYGNLRIAGHRFNSSYRLRSFLWLALGNMLGMIVTLGMYYPWARVRTARYAAEHVTLTATGDLAEFAAAQGQEMAAVGSELGDVFDVDLGF